MEIIYACQPRSAGKLDSIAPAFRKSGKPMRGFMEIISDDCWDVPSQVNKISWL